MDIKEKLIRTIEYLIMKGGKKNLSKLIKVKRPFKTKSGKVGYRDTWVLPGQVKHDEKIHNDHKLHHLLPKEHPDYKKKEMHPNFEAGREKHHEERRKNKKGKEQPKAQEQPKSQDGLSHTIHKNNTQNPEWHKKNRLHQLNTVLHYGGHKPQAGLRGLSFKDKNGKKVEVQPHDTGSKIEKDDGSTHIHIQYKTGQGKDKKHFDHLHQLLEHHLGKEKADEAIKKTAENDHVESALIERTRKDTDKHLNPSTPPPKESAKERPVKKPKAEKPKSEEPKAEKPKRKRGSPIFRTEMSRNSAEAAFHRYYNHPNKSKKATQLMKDVKKKHYEFGGNDTEWHDIVNGKSFPKGDHPIIPHMVHAMEHMANEKQRKHRP